MLVLQRGGAANIRGKVVYGEAITSQSPLLAGAMFSTMRNGSPKKRKRITDCPARQSGNMRYVPER
jgi:hypothetical protein